MFRTRDGWVIRKVPREDDNVERHFAISGLPREEDDITWMDHIIEELHKVSHANLTKVRRVWFRGSTKWIIKWLGPAYQKLTQFNTDEGHTIIVQWDEPPKRKRTPNARMEPEIMVWDPATDATGGASTGGKAAQWPSARQKHRRRRVGG